MSTTNEASSESARRLGSYTTAKVTQGRVERVERHAQRLRRDAGRLGLALPEQTAIEELFVRTAAERFPSGDGIIRIEWSHLPNAAPELLAIPREFNPLANEWRAAISTVVHPGREFRANTKYVDMTAYDRGREEISTAEFDEVLLFDADGTLVEGAHSNFLAVTANGQVVTPATDLGPVEGLGLTIVREGPDPIAEVRLNREEVLQCREFMSVNAVRGVVPILQIDGKPVGKGVAGEWATRLGSPFSRR